MVHYHERDMRALITMAALFLLVMTGTAQATRAQCRANLTRGRVTVRVELDQLLDRDLSRLIRLGLHGRIQVDVTLMRSRRFWFDDELERQSRHFTLAYLRRRGFYLGRTPVLNPQLFPLKVISVGNRIVGGGLYVVVAVRLRVVTASSLRQAADWITNSTDTSGIVQDRLIKMVVSDLTRSAGARCDL